MKDKAANPPPEPPEGPVTNVAQLKASIDAGGTGDKVSASDPAAAPLGTDDEAAGVSHSASEIQAEHATQARTQPAAQDTRSPDLTENALPKPGAGMGLILGIVAALLLAAILGWFVLSQGAA